MSRRKSNNEDLIKAVLFLILALGTALSFAVSLIVKRIPHVISYFKTMRKHPSIKKESFLEVDMSGNIFLDRARERERYGDYLGARVEFMKCIEDLKRSNQDGNLDAELQHAQNEYDEFVKRDPVYAALLSRLLTISKAHPGIMQSDITKNFKKADWSELTSYAREVTKEDIGYALYFAAKQGVILRTKKGRSYELRVVEDVPFLQNTPVK